MQASELKDLVKKYFNLTEAPESVEGIVIKKNKEAFAEIKTADGSVTLMYDGELGVGTVLSIHDAEGNVIPAPAGEHLLENGERVVLDENGAVTEFLTPTEAPAETMEEEMMPEEEAPMTEDLMPALIEAVVEAVQDEMKKYGERMSAVESKLETFSAAPAATKTLPKKNNPLVKKQEEIAAPLQAERFNRIMEMAAKRK
jgi:hypothetical protein